MPHAYQNGIGGSLNLNLGSPATLDVKVWTLNDENKTLETPNTGGSSMTRIAGMFDWSVECEAYWDLNQVPSNAATNIVPGTTGAVVLNVGSTGKTYSGNVIVQKAPVKNDCEDKIGFTFTLQGNGPLTRPT